jgi:iron complex outermembrane receptor protein
MIGVSLNNGSTISDKGFVNYTIDFSKVNLANRPGKVDLEGEFADNGGSIQGLNFDINSFSQNHAAKHQRRSRNSSAKFLVNGGINLSDETKMYYNAAYVYKKVNSFANYRTPYWSYGNGITSNNYS